MNDELDKKTQDLDKKDWIDIGYKSRIITPDEVILGKFLRCPFNNITKVSKTLSPYKQFICRAVLEEYINEKEYIISERKEWNEFGEHIFSYEQLEIAPDVFKKVPDGGVLFITSKTPDKPRLAVELANIGEDKYIFTVYSQNDFSSEGEKFLEGIFEYAKSHNVLKGKVVTAQFKPIKVSDKYSWDSVILPVEIKEEIRNNVQLLIKNIDVYRNNNMVFKRGLILKGSPGVGKTMLLKVLCNELKGTSIIWVTSGGIDRTYKVKFVAEMARELSPSILFLEDIDLYGSHREQGNKEILGELMNQLDGLVENEFVIVIATTNRADEVEDALRNRPGRFDRSIEISKPDRKCRIEMLRSFLSNVNTSVKNTEKLYGALADLTDGFTGAHMKELVNSAVISSIDGGSLDKNGKIVLTLSHFEENLERVKIKKIEPAGFTTNTSDDRRFRTLEEIFGDDDCPSTSAED